MKAATETKFKQTELGLLPEGWDVTEFRKVLSEKSRNGIYKQKQFHGAGVRIINMKELFAFPRIGNQNMKRVRLDHSETSRFLVRTGDLLFARRSLVAEGSGKCSLIVEHSEPMTFESSMILARPDNEVADSEFLYYFFSSPKGHQVMDTILRQVAVSGITGTDLMKLSIIKPPIPEQKSVARTLSHLDAKIELNQQMNKTLEALGKAIFKHWFVDFEFPNEEGKPYRSSGGEMIYNEELKEEIPKGWQSDKLGNHSIIKGRIGWKGLQVSEYVDDGPRIVGGKQIVDYHVYWDDCPKVSQVRYEESPEIILKEGDILMTKDGTIGKLAFLDDLKEPATVASGIFVIRSNSSIINQMYLWNYFKSDIFRSLVETRIEGSVVPHLYQRDITDLQMVLSTVQISSQFESVARNIQQKINANSEVLSIIRKMRDLILPRLMSGKLRIPVEAG